jgi:glucose/arabinose dehydrogenase
LFVAVGEGRVGEFAIDSNSLAKEKTLGWRQKAADRLRGSLRGKILRIDVDRNEGERRYAIPPSNPFIGESEIRPEVWALGFRNPWRFSFAPDDRLLVADVGDYTREEISLVDRGENHGWPIREGSICAPGIGVCENDDAVDPIFDYSRKKGMAVIGGYVYQGSRIPALTGRYVFGDMLSGRIWALVLPEEARRVDDAENVELGRWAHTFSTFGRDSDGEIYVGDMRGRIHRLDPMTEALEN